MAGRHSLLCYGVSASVLSLIHICGAVDIIVVDSVAALTPRAEIEGEMGDTHVGLLARLMSQAMRKLTGNISKNNTTMIFINQVREKVGVMYGNPEVTTGGRDVYKRQVELEDGTRIDVVTAGEFIEKGEPVQVVRKDGTWLVVEKRRTKE